MFKVRCPANLLWLPSLHHSLFLLRGLRQPHTLVITPSTQPSGSGSYLPFPLLADLAGSVSVTAENPTDSSPHSIRRVHCPEHIPWMFALSTTGDALPLSSSSTSTADSVTPPPLLLLRRDMPAYLETSLVSGHLLSKTDALLVALNTGEMEAVRQLHAALMDAVAQLDETLRDDGTESGSGQTGATEKAAAAVEEPLSTWPLYTALRFLVEEGGLLTSAYPRVLAAYTRLSLDPAVAHHGRLVQRTIEAATKATATSSGTTAAATSITTSAVEVSVEYPARGFLAEVQRRLGDYTTSAEERLVGGVTGDGGPLRSRVSGGRMGLQTVPARVPWTAQRTPLKRR